MTKGQTYKPRLIEQAFTTAMAASPVVVITGARQVGKSTFAEHATSELGAEYLTLDDLGILERATHEPDALIDQPGTVILDEVQRAPELLFAVKRAVDRDRRAGRFVLTGSTNLLVAQRVAESLAGRAVYLDLWPLTRSERRGMGGVGPWDMLINSDPGSWPSHLSSSDAPLESWQECAWIGGYPVPSLQLPDARSRDVWFAGYVRTYLERDLQELRSIGSLVDFRRLMKAACLRIGNLVNQTELGRDVGMPQSTVHGYLNLLEESYQLARLQAFSLNRTKRLIKSPKLYWADTGLALHLADVAAPSGSHLENLILQELLAWRDSHLRRPNVLYWRTASGSEVDFVIELGSRLLPIEVKSSAEPSLKDVRGLKEFLEEYADMASGGILIHTGDSASWIADGILAVPWWQVT